MDAPGSLTVAGREATSPRFARLRALNLLVGTVHLAQVVAILLLANDFTLPVTRQFAAGPPGSELFTEREVLWDVRVGPAVALFLALAAADHLIVAAPGVFPWYVRNLQRRINYARWYEYSVSASLMIVLIAMVTGVTDFAALIAIAGVNAAMIFFGLMMELHNQSTERTNWTSFLFGCVAGIIPWIIVAIQVIGAESETGGEVPTFVYGIIVSLFVLFNSFAVNMWLQYARIGPWRDYLFGEAAYIFLSLVAKSLLAWQIFANTLMD